MRTLHRALLPVVLACSPVLALAQTGTLDQVSPFQPVGYGTVFNADSSSLVWQAQVRAAQAGQLEGITLQLNATQGAGTLQVRLRMGAGWNTTPPVFQTAITSGSNGVHDVFVDTTSANVQLAPGSVFVIELQGLNTGTYLNGSYVDPSFGAPLYPEPLFQNGPGCYSDCGWRIGFKTYLLQGGPTELFCFGDGSASACPCGNASATGANEGCLNSSALGATLRGTGAASIGFDSLALSSSHLPGAVPTFFFQGNAAVNLGAGLVLGDGLRCAGGALIRLGVKFASGGTAAYPQAGDLSISQRGQCVAGSTYYYQALYRDPANFCSIANFNLSNGFSAQWTP